MYKNPNVFKFVAMFILVVFIMISTGCVDKNTKITLKGESIHWKGELNSSITGQDESGMYTLFYKDEDWDDVQVYKIDINDGKVILEETGLTTRTIEIPMNRTKSSVTSNEPQTVNIIWNDSRGNEYEENILLKPIG
ncbi:MULTISPECIES: hypothetical protein [Paenibacillus]|uniref:hypothetical protein n=1 Tax=Paenibacillus TaxID=44249 RepID=UPI00188A2258|nr:MULTISPECIES: hypothetical protein [Paenibacillus]MBX4148510.1 hypothetical protein [Paenibacillus lautus]